MITVTEDGQYYYINGIDNGFTSCQQRKYQPDPTVIPTSVPLSLKERTIIALCKFVLDEQKLFETEKIRHHETGALLKETQEKLHNIKEQK